MATCGGPAAAVDAGCTTGGGPNPLGRMPPLSRGLHSSTDRLNVGGFSVIGGAFRGYLGSVQEESGGIRRC